MAYVADANKKKAHDNPLLKRGSRQWEVAKEVEGIKESNKKRFTIGDIFGRGNKKKKKG
jgi:hypothetical protein